MIMQGKWDMISIHIKNQFNQIQVEKVVEIIPLRNIREDMDQFYHIRLFHNEADRNYQSFIYDPMIKMSNKDKFNLPTHWKK